MTERFELVPFGTHPGDDRVDPVSVAQTEGSFQGQVEHAARQQGWKAYHTQYSIRSEAGFPDLVLVRPPRLIFAELKSLHPRSKLSAAQRSWLEALAGCAVEVYLWTPRDWSTIHELLLPDHLRRAS